MEDNKLSKENIAEVVNVLIGKTYPVGETNEDERRYKNLEVANEVFYQLFNQLTYIIYNTRTAYQGSIILAREKAKKIIENTIGDYLYDRGYRKVGKDLWELTNE